MVYIILNITLSLLQCIVAISYIIKMKFCYQYYIL